jgi:hypothetical protein
MGFLFWCSVFLCGVFSDFNFHGRSTDRGISLGRMTAEQRRIRQKYPMFFDEV